ncbi:MAG: hypothetical protein IKO47_03815 [Ruminococcus sp.]|nr:hypothetical protein [Ruminococcus sp.]
MELLVMPKGNKYIVEDRKQRLLYTIKKKGFGQKYNLLDASNYVLYTIVQTGDDRKPAFTIVLNDTTFMKLECKSLFLDPTINADGKTVKYSIASKDRREFDLILDGNTVGHIKTKVTVTNELHYDIEIENTAFDDYIPLFAVAIDKTFGDMNRQK